jgi:hypothetical protein
MLPRKVKDLSAIAFLTGLTRAGQRARIGGGSAFCVGLLLAGALASGMTGCRSRNDSRSSPWVFSTEFPAPGKQAHKTLTSLLKAYELTTLSGKEPVGWVDGAEGVDGDSTTIGSTEKVRIRGWAADPTVGLTAKEVWIASGDAVLAMTVPMNERIDLVTTYNFPGYHRAGWMVELAPSDLPPGLERTFAAYAVLQDRRRIVKLSGEAQVRVIDSREALLRVYQLVAPAYGPSGYLDGAAGVRSRLPSLAPKETLIASGWAFDRAARRPAKEVWLVSGNLVLGHARPRAKRQDLVKALGTEAAIPSGWQAQISASRMPPGPTWTLEAYAVLQDGRTLVKLVGDRLISVREPN